MSIFTTRYGEQRFTCFATGASGTAIDLVMTSRSMNFRDSLEWLAGRAGVAEVPMSKLPPRTEPVRPKRQPMTPKEPDPGLADWVEKCRTQLGTPEAKQARRWLVARGIPEELQQEHGLGYDPGPSKLARIKGLPRFADAVIFPVRNEKGELVYAQSRPINPTGKHKYHNPNGAVAPHPHIGFLDNGRDRVLVAEGLPDALVANAKGLAAVAVLGTSNAMREDVAERIGEFAGDRPVVLALDADVPTASVDKAAFLLEQTCAQLSVLDLKTGDLTDLWKDDAAAVTRVVEQAVADAVMVR